MNFLLKKFIDFLDLVLRSRNFPRASLMSILIRLSQINEPDAIPTSRVNSRRNQCAVINLIFVQIFFHHASMKL